MDERTIDWKKLAEKAWEVRENASVLEHTQVGAALLTTGENIYTGCNVEHSFRSHDIHAEVNAISSMVAAGEKRFVAIIVAAKRHKFTPCGGCMDWIMEHGGKDCLVAYQNEPGGKITIYKADELMPHYPEF